MEQWILIRGMDRDNPVLLWLHGGPGSAEMPIARRSTRGLEEHFVVVHWDHRGDGKSNPADFDEASRSTSRMRMNLRAFSNRGSRGTRSASLAALGAPNRESVLQTGGPMTTQATSP